jgi:hypothetical protein
MSVEIALGAEYGLNERGASLQNSAHAPLGMSR